MAEAMAGSLTSPMSGSVTSRMLKQITVENDFRVYLTIDFVVGFATGLVRSYYDDPFPGFDCWYALLEVIGVGTTFAALSAADLAWGWPEMAETHHRRLRELLSCLWFLATVCLYPIAFYSNGFYGFLIILSLVPTLHGGLRGWPLLLGAVCWVAVSGFSHDDFDYDNVLPYLKVGIGVGVPAYLRYLHDQRLAVSICIMPLFSFFLGYVFRRVIIGDRDMFRNSAFMMMFGFLLLYCNVLLRSCRRPLPPGLFGAKFVRLSFLREMLRNGEKIRRCQELPEEAFGDASKAIHFIVVSHRWHDPRTCDVTAADCPQGVKLTNLVRRLDEHFLPSPTGSLWQRMLRWYRITCIGGWDVVLFFDFLSIPQNGIAADGSTILRTPAETRVFDECLPNMGTLYSLFPVLTLTDVPEDDTDHGYIESGWCFCEFVIAMLNQQLTLYSNETLQAVQCKSLIRASRHSMDEEAAVRFQADVMSELERRPFSHESDRKVAGGIIEGFLTKRLLADSIRNGDMARVQRLLMQLAQEGLLSTLNEPVDDCLNTLLHIAVQSREVDAVKALLSYGARPYLRNYSGDTSSQLFLFPRICSAARMAREASEKAARRGHADTGAAKPAEDVELARVLHSH